MPCSLAANRSSKDDDCVELLSMEKRPISFAAQKKNCDDRHRRQPEHDDQGLALLGDSRAAADVEITRARRTAVGGGVRRGKPDVIAGSHLPLRPNTGRIFG